MVVLGWVVLVWAGVVVWWDLLRVLGLWSYSSSVVVLGCDPGAVVVGVLRLWWWSSNRWIGAAGCWVIWLEDLPGLPGCSDVELKKGSC